MKEFILIWLALGLIMFIITQVVVVQEEKVFYLTNLLYAPIYIISGPVLPLIGIVIWFRKHRNKDVALAIKRAKETASDASHISEKSFDDFLDEEGIREEVEEKASESIRKWNSLPWYKKFYYSYIKREYPF